MSTFRVFLGAPSIPDLDEDPISYRWDTISSSHSETSHARLPSPPDFPTIELLDDASRRISRIYENVIFDEDDVEDQPDENIGGEDDRFIPTTPGNVVVNFLSKRLVY